MVGITSRTKSSPNTWRWQQHAAWVRQHGFTNIKNDSIPATLWAELGNTQPKVTPSNPPAAWDAPSILGPARDEQTRRALQLAYSLYRIGGEQRREFGRLLATTEAAKLDWGRALMAELRR